VEVVEHELLPGAQDVGGGDVELAHRVFPSSWSNLPTTWVL
jgi:hypothetical protein